MLSLEVLRYHLTRHKEKDKKKMNREKLNYLLESIESFNAYKAEEEELNWLAIQCMKILNVLTNE